MSSTPPTSVIRDGSLKATIWENQGEKGTYFTTTFAKTYRDPQRGDLRDTHAFSQNDLARLNILTQEAHAKTRELYQEHSKSKNQERTPEKTPEHTPVRTQEGTPARNPEEYAADLQTRAKAFDKEHERGESREEDYALEF